MSHDFPLGNQPNFGLISTNIHGAATEIEKCSNLPGVQDGNIMVRLLEGIQSYLHGMNQSLDNRFNTMNRSLDDRFNTMNRSLDDRFNSMERRFGNLADTVNDRLDGVDERLDKIAESLDGVDGRLDDMDKRFDGIEYHVEAMSGHIDGIDKRLDGMDRRFEQIDGRFDRMGDQFDELSARISANEHNSVSRLENRFNYGVNQNLAPLRSNANELIEQFPQTPSAILGLNEQTLDRVLLELDMSVSGDLDEKRARLRLAVGLRP